MSFVFDINPDAQRQLDSLARSNPAPADQNDSGFWDGVPKGIGMGVMRGGAKVGQAVGMAAGGVLSIIDEGSGKLTDPYFRQLDQFVNDAPTFWTPDANTVGTAGRILGGFSEMALPLMAGGGNPSLLIGTTEMSGATELSRQGASNAGAVAGGVIEGAANAIGFKIPFLGRTLATRVLSGMAGNVAVGAGAAGAEKAALNLTGDTQLAENIHPLDAEARLIDLLSGAAFGGIAHLGMRDAVKTAANAKHFQHDTAPGTPADLEASVAHQAAIDEGIRSIMEDRPVNLSETGVQDANFLHDRRLPKMDSMPEEVKGVDEAVKQGPAPNPDRVELEVQPRGGAKESAVRVDNRVEPNQPIMLRADSAPQERAFAQEGQPPADRAVDTSTQTVHPIVSAAHDALRREDIQIPTGTLHEDGTAITQSGREVMAKLDQETQAAHNDAKAFDALANCILFRGS